MIKEARIVSLVSLFPLPQYVVVLEDVEKTRLVPIWIGVNEGNAIALELQGEKFPRPLTHDLMVNLLALLSATVEKVIINDLRENSYYALIYIQVNGKILSLDARPSDSLALAVRIHCPIFIDEKVLKKCRIIEKPITKEDIERFKSELKNMTPEEFFKNLDQTSAAQDPEIGKGGWVSPPVEPEEESEEDPEDTEDPEEDPR